MTTETQKWLELRYATKACEKLDMLWEITPSPNEIDWPDLLVTEDGYRFGLEVREIFPDESFKGSKKRRDEASNVRVITEISEKYYALSEVPIRVKFIGSVSDQELIVNKLVSASSTLKDSEQVRLELAPECVLYITKLHLSFKNYNRWVYVSDQVGWVSNLDAGFIQEKIDEKSAKLVKYIKNINDVRLLLVCNRELNSGKFVCSPEGLINLAGFKEVYFLSYPELACKLSS